MYVFLCYQKNHKGSSPNYCSESKNEWTVPAEKNEGITAIQIPHPPLNPALAGRCRIAGVDPGSR